MNELDDLEIRHATFIRANPEQVYDAFTSADGLDAWFTDGADVDPRTERSAFAHVINSVSGTWNSLLKSLPISFIGKELY